MAEKTYTVTLTEDELFRVVVSLKRKAAQERRDRDAGRSHGIMLPKYEAAYERLSAIYEGDDNAP